MILDLDPDITGKLLLATLLGGLIGLERELRHKAAGLRTIMFICIGSTLFTLLSTEIANRVGGDHVRIAAQLIPGIGFLGAGAILHSGAGGVMGLTTAATIFVVASVGMAIGAGLYSTAIFTTLLILAILIGLGWTEKRFERKD